MRPEPITSEELIQFLIEIGIKEEGAKAVDETYPMGLQKAQIKNSIQEGISVWGKSPKKATRVAWADFWKIQKLRKRPVGSKPAEEDFLKL